MAAFRSYDLPTFYRELAQEARRRAETADGQPNEKLWQELADSWEFLAKLQADRCFCGAPSIGYKFFPNGDKRAACRSHMTELVIWGILNRLGHKKLH